MRVSPPPPSCEFIRKIYRPNVFLTIPIVHDRESMSWDTYCRIGKPNRDSDYTMLNVSFKVNFFYILDGAVFVQVPQSANHVCI